jgi:hypothetical protein
MVMYETIDTLVRGLLGLGFTFMFISYFEESVWTRAEPVLKGIGMSQLSAQVIDAQFYGVDAFLVLGVIFVLGAAVVWAANWG